MLLVHARYNLPPPRFGTRYVNERTPVPEVWLKEKDQKLYITWTSPYSSSFYSRPDCSCVFLPKIPSVLHRIICCGCVLESPPRGDSNTHPEHMFLWRNIENYHFLSFLFQPQISPMFTICKVQIWGHFCKEMVSMM